MNDEGEDREHRSERRRAERIPANDETVALMAALQVPVTILDLSATGARLASDDGTLLAPGDNGFLYLASGISDPSGSMGICEIAVEVAWTEGPIAGVRFLSGDDIIPLEVAERRARLELAYHKNQRES